MKTIDLPDLLAAMASARPPTLLEALPARYFAEGHLPAARHCPEDRLDAVAGSLLLDARVVVYCANPACRNSHRVAEALVARGFLDVAVFVGGKQAWVEAGLALVRPGPTS